MVNSGVGESREMATFEQTRADTLNETFFLRNFYSKTRQFLIRRLIIGDDSFWSFARCIVRSTNYHGLKRYTYPDPFRYFTQLFLLFLFHFLFFFRIHAARRHTSSLFFSLSIRSLKNYVTYHDKVAHLLKIKNW